MIGAALVTKALASIGGAGVMTKIIVAGVLLASLVVSYGVWHKRVYERGEADAIAAIARGDAKVVSRAQNARKTFRDCRAVGRQWDQTTGRCQ